MVFFFKKKLSTYNLSLLLIASFLFLSSCGKYGRLQSPQSNVNRQQKEEERQKQQKMENQLKYQKLNQSQNQSDYYDNDFIF